MKKQSNSLFTTMSNENLSDLTSFVNETLATTCKKLNGKIFTTADLWNIQRQSKSSILRRHRL
jgi:hypothetical protein